MINTVSSYKRKFELMLTDLTNNTFDHFPNMQDHLKTYPSFVFQTERYVTEIGYVTKDPENKIP
jgi:hypothetical protein